MNVAKDQINANVSSIENKINQIDTTKNLYRYSNNLNFKDASYYKASAIVEVDVND